MSVACKIFDLRSPDWGRRKRFIGPQRLILKEELRMKKVLSLVLAFAMILGSFGFVFGSDFTDVKDTEVYSEAVNALAGLGVIGGYPDGTFKPANVVTRAEMATMIVNALGIPVSGGAATRFSDVPASHWASGYIAYAVSVGFVAGYPDGTFKPEQQVTCNEALTMIVASLGYTLDSLTGDYPGAFVNAARGLGTLNTCKKSGTIGAERSDIACYLYDTLRVPMGVVNKDNEFVPTVAKNGAYDTMLRRLGATETNPFVVTGTEDTVINLGSYLGALITAYENKDGEIVAIGEVKSEFIEGDFEDDLEDTYVFDSAKLGYTYTSNGSDYKVNYLSFTNGDKDAKTDENYKQDGIKLAVKLSGKTVKEIYSMQIWDGAVTFQAAEDVQDTLADSNKIENYKFALDDNKEIDTNSFILEGKDSIKDIKEDDVVTIYLHTSGDNKDKVSKIQVSDKVVEGVITKTNGKTERNKIKATIDGTAHGINLDGDVQAKDLTDLMSSETTAAFYLDFAGKIFAIDDELGVKNYAVLLDTGSASDFDHSGANYKLKMFLPDGTTKVFEAKKAAYETAKGNTGVVVEYRLNSDNVVKTVTIGDGSATKGKFTTKGVFDNKTLGDSTVAFSYEGTTKAEDLADADNYDVIKVNSLYDAEFVSMKYIAADGAFRAVLVEGAENTDTVYAIVTGKSGENKDGSIYTVLYDGDVKDYTFTEDVADANIYTSGAAVKVTKLTFNGSGNASAKTFIAKTAKAAVIDSARGSVSGSVYTDSAKNKYTLDDDVAIYVYNEDGDWVKGTAADMKGGSSAIDSIYLLDTDDKADGEYDIVLVFVAD